MTAIADAVPDALPTPAPASPSFWRWLRPSPKVVEKPKGRSLPPSDEMEERLLALLAGVHQQVVADAQHSEQLATLSRRRSDVRVSALEEQQRRLDIRLNDLSAGLKNIEKAAPAATLSQLHVELSELRRSVRLVASNQQEACKREVELQEHVCHRLKPLEERVSALEGEALSPKRSACDGEKVQLEADSEKSFRSFETNEEPSTVGFPVPMDHSLRQLEKRLDEELEKIRVQIGAFSVSEAKAPVVVRALDERIAACEASCQRIDVFVDRFKDLAGKVQEGFADARGHLDQVLLHLGAKRLPDMEKTGLDEMQGALEVKTSVDSLVDDGVPKTSQAQRELERHGTDEGASLPKKEGPPTLDSTKALFELASSADGFEASKKQKPCTCRDSDRSERVRTGPEMRYLDPAVSDSVE